MALIENTEMHLKFEKNDMEVQQKKGILVVE